MGVLVNGQAPQSEKVQDAKTLLEHAEAIGILVRSEDALVDRKSGSLRSRSCDSLGKPPERMRSAEIRGKVSRPDGGYQLLVLLKKFITIRRLNWGSWVSEIVFPLLMLALFCTPFAIDSPFTEIPLRKNVPASGIIQPLEYYTAYANSSGVSNLYPTWPYDVPTNFKFDSWQRDANTGLEIWLAGAESKALNFMASTLNAYYGTLSPLKNDYSPPPVFKVVGSNYTLEQAFKDNEDVFFGGIQVTQWPFKSGDNNFKYQIRMNGTAVADTGEKMQSITYMSYFDPSQIAWTSYLSTGFVALERAVNIAGAITDTNCATNGNNCPDYTAQAGTDFAARINPNGNNFPKYYQAFVPPTENAVLPGSTAVPNPFARAGQCSDYSSTYHKELDCDSEIGCICNQYAGFYPNFLVRWLPGWLVNISLNVLLVSLLAQMAFEQESGITRGFLLMGVPPFFYWCHWLIVFVVQSVPFAAIMPGILLGVGLVDHVDYSVIFIHEFLFLGVVAIFAVAVSSTLASNSSACAGVSIAFTFASAGLYLLASLAPFPEWLNLIFCVIPWFASHHGLGLMVVARFTQEPLTWATAWERGFMWVLIVQILSIIPWTLLGLWLHSPKKAPPAVGDVPARHEEGHQSGLNASPPAYAEGKSMALKVRGVRRRFGDTMVVNGWDLDLYRGEIYGLLGHNGAGKTTSISMISGELSSSGGSIEYKLDNGEFADLNGPHGSHMKEKLIGVCPQKDLIFPELTGRQHIEMFCQIKGVPLSEGLTVMDDCDLTAHLDKNVGNYSGGMIRRVTFANALLGSPPVIFLDEPTAGMDPATRRLMWQLIYKIKRDKNCAVLLTTHFMDEADILSDRIGILAEGVLISSGTSLFLKHKFGAGYCLTVSPKFVAPPTKAIDLVHQVEDKQAKEKDKLKRVSDVSIVTGSSSAQSDDHAAAHFKDQEECQACHALIKQHIPKALMVEPWVWSLPVKSAGRFPQLLVNLHDYDFSLGLTTLEEVFLKCKDPREMFEHKRTGSSLNAPPSGSPAVSRDGAAFKQLGSGSTNFSRTGTNLSQLVPPNVHMSPEQLSEAVMHPTRDSLMQSGHNLTGQTAEFQEKFGEQRAPSFEKPPADTSTWKKLKTVCWVLFIRIKRMKDQLIFNLLVPLLLGCIGFVAEKIAVSSPVIDNPPSVGIGANPSSFALTPADTMQIPVPGDNFSCANAWIPPAVARADGSAATLGPWGGCYGGLVNSATSTVASASSPTADMIVFNASQVLALPQLEAQAAAWQFAPYTFSVDDKPMAYFKEEAFDIPEVVTPLLTSLMLSALGYHMLEVAKLKYAKIQLQFEMLGVSTWTYMLGHFYFAMTVLFIPMFVFSVILGIALNSGIVGGRSYDGGDDGWTVDSRFVGFLLLFVLFATACIPFAIALIPCFSSMRQMAGDFPLMWNLVFAIPFIILYMFQSSSDQTMKELGAIISWIFMAFPGFAYQMGAKALIHMSRDKSTYYQGVDYKVVFNPANPVESNVFIPIMSEFVMTFLATYLMWHRAKGGHLRDFVYCRICRRRFRKDTGMTVKRDVSITFSGDPLLQSEIDRASKLKDEKNHIVAYHMVKEYDNGYRAVNNVSLAVAPRELCVLLGPNGAGKTSLMKTFIGEQDPTKGSAMLSGVDASTDEIWGVCGYCPQFSALVDIMTVREHMLVVDNLQQCGVDEAMQMVEDLGLTRNAETQAYSLSGGNQRKVSLAIALLARNQCLLLDEPSTGVDPASRRQLWDVLKKVTRPTMLTTHVMEEAEALATTIAIMAKGQLLTIGSVPLLKSRFITHFTLLAMSHNEQAADELLNRIPDSELTENVGGQMQISISIRPNVPLGTQLAEVFELMEKVKDELQIEFYSVAQTTLENIFMDFVTGNQQRVTKMVSKTSLHMASGDVKPKFSLESLSGMVNAEGVQGAGRMTHISEHSQEGAQLMKISTLK